MTILAISDIESPYLWNETQPQRLPDVDLVLSCGDLDPHYLSFIATFTHAPVLYVHGNHDGRYAGTPPDGCICIEDQLYVHKGVRIVGLGGSMRYSGGAHQYTQQEMNARIRRLRMPLWRHGGFDILLTHAPAANLGDGDDLPHRGFEGFRRLIERHQPTFMVHGHTHLNYGHSYARLNQHGRTIIINAYEKYQFCYARTDAVQDASDNR